MRFHIVGNSMLCSCYLPMGPVYISVMRMEMPYCTRHYNPEFLILWSSESSVVRLSTSQMKDDLSPPHQASESRDLDAVQFQRAHAHGESVNVLNNEGDISLNIALILDMTS